MWVAHNPKSEKCANNQNQTNKTSLNQYSLLFFELSFVSVWLLLYILGVVYGRPEFIKRIFELYKHLATKFLIVISWNINFDIF